MSWKRALPVQLQRQPTPLLLPAVTLLRAAMSRQRPIPAPRLRPLPPPTRPPPRGPARQRGIATALIVLPGLPGPTAGVLGTVSPRATCRSKDRHGPRPDLQAQMSPTGREVVQQYLASSTAQPGGPAQTAAPPAAAGCRRYRRRGRHRGPHRRHRQGRGHHHGAHHRRAHQVSRAEARSVLEVVYGAEAGSELAPPAMPRLRHFPGNLSITRWHKPGSATTRASFRLSKIAVDAPS